MSTRGPWLVLAFLAPAFLAGCARLGSAAPGDALIGTWDVTRPERSRQVYEFRPGGAVSIKTEAEPNQWGRPAQGTWEVVTATGIAREVRFRYDGREELLIINVKDKDTLTLSDWKGRDIVFRRRK